MSRARDRASADLNGQEFILDADADTSISADTDDQIDIKIAGADDFQFTANTFTAQSGSTIAAQALTATTITASGVVDVTDTTDASDATGDTGALRTEGGASIAKKLYVGTDLDVDGTANLDVVDIDGAVDMASTLTVSGTTKLGEIASIGQSSPLSPNDATSFLHIGDNNNQDTSIILEDGVEIWEIYQNDTLSFRKDTTIVQELHRDGYVTQPLNPMWWAHDTSNNNAANTTNDAYETFVFDSETYDIGGGYNTSNGRYVAPVAGKYFVHAKLLIQGLNASAEYYQDIAIFVNGAQKLRHAREFNSYARAQSITISGLVHCDASDYIEVKIRFENVSNQVVYAAQSTAYFQGFLVG
jgi:hypothetical protein